MSDNTMPERLHLTQGEHFESDYLDVQSPTDYTTEYIRADVAQAQLAERDARIAELEAAQRWISVDERLPEAGDIVLAHLPDYQEVVIINKWPKRQATSRLGSSWNESSRVTHWMPLPPPVTPET